MWAVSVPEGGSGVGGSEGLAELATMALSFIVLLVAFCSVWTLHERDSVWTRNGLLAADRWGCELGNASVCVRVIHGL